MQPPRQPETVLGGDAVDGKGYQTPSAAEKQEGSGAEGAGAKKGGGSAALPSEGKTKDG